MPLSEQTRREAWALAQGRCECQRDDHGHVGRCNRVLRYPALGLLRADGWFALEWQPVDSGGLDEPGNCEVVCAQCYLHAVSPTGEGPGEGAPPSPA